MDPLSEIEWLILDATADDWENLEQIHRSVTADYRPATTPPSLEEIADGIRSLVHNGLLTGRWGENGAPVQETEDLSYVWRAWFNMTPRGRAAWASSPYATRLEGPAPL
jgi:hypothetical protein